jgi:hypothetical protein
MMLFRLHDNPTDEDPITATLLADIARRAREQAQAATAGREARFRRLAAQYAHLGTAADELLAHALHDIDATPAYFGAVARHGLEQTLKPPDETTTPEIIEGSAQPVKKKEKGEHE